MKTRLLKFILIMLTSAQLQTKGEEVLSQITAQDDTVHLEMSGLKTWDYKIEKKQGKDGRWFVELWVNPLEQNSIKEISKFKNPLIQIRQIKEAEIDGKTKMIIDLASKDVEVFDYLTDQPSRLIIDFYENKKQPTKAPVAKTDSKKIQKTDVNNNEATTRQPATADFLKISNSGTIAMELSNTKTTKQSGIFDGADPFFERFTIQDHEINEDAIIKSKDNYYVNFPNLDLFPIDFTKILKSKNVFSLVPEGNDENKQARLLWTLFDKKRDLVYLKTLKWFNEKFPESKYNEIIDFMTIEVYFRQWENKNDDYSFSLVQQKLESVIQKYPESALAEKSSFLLGALNYRKGDYFNALRFFQNHKDNNKIKMQGNFSKELAKLGMAVSFMKIKKPNDAFQILDDLEKTTPFANLKSEAAYRKGDVYLTDGKFESAIAEYDRANKMYSSDRPNFPNSTYNKALAQFKLSQFKTSLNTYREFIQLYPDHEYSPFAMTRVGELLEVLGADHSKVMGAYLETFFRNGENPSAIVARLRIMSDKFVEMKEKEVESATKEIMGLTQKVNLPGLEQFSTLIIADGFRKRKEFSKAIDLLEKFYQKNPHDVDVKMFQNKIIANINEKMKSEIEQGEFLKGLETYKKYSDHWLKFSNRFDTNYFLGRAYEQAGVPSEASNYYRGVLNKIYSIQGSNELKERTIKEYLPSVQELNLRLANVEVSGGHWNQAYNFLKDIKKPELLNEDQQIERIQLSVRVFDNRGDTESAIRYLTEILREWKGQPEKVADPYYSLGLLELKQKKPNEALKSFEKVRTLASDTGLVKQETYFKALDQIAQMYFNQKEMNKAAEVYTEMLEKFENQRPLASLRYRLGKIYFDLGELQKANEVWSQFRGEKSDFWKNLAQEQLKGSEWKDNYKKYIQRIPAMSQKE